MYCAAIGLSSWGLFLDEVSEVSEVSEVRTYAWALDQVPQSKRTAGFGVTGRTDET